LKGLSRKKRDIEKEIEQLSSDIEDIKTKVDLYYSRYINILKMISSRESQSDSERRRTDAARTVGKMIEKARIGFELASIEMIRPLGEKAFKKAIEKKDRLDEMRLMTGAISAQMSIVNEIFQRRSCICGTPIGKTGMGRERIEHLISKLEHKRDINSRWEGSTIWFTDQYLKKVEYDLGRIGPRGQELTSILRSQKMANRTINEIKGIDDVSKNRGELLEAVREHERSKVLNMEKGRSLKRYRNELETITREMEKISLKMEGDVEDTNKIDLKSKLELVEASIKEVERIIEERRYLSLGEVIDVANSIFKRIRPKDQRVIVIHGSTYSIGYMMKISGTERVLPAWKLSTGEREAMILSIILAINKTLDNSMILDSPFTNMEKDSRDNALEVLLDMGNSLLMIPEGHLEMKKIKDRHGQNDKISHLTIENIENGSRISEVKY
jgi:hypothetical protein